MEVILDKRISLSLTIAFILAMLIMPVARAQYSVPWADSVILLGNATADTSAAFDISSAANISALIKWAGVHASDSAVVTYTLQVSNSPYGSSDTTAANWKAIGAVWRCSTSTVGTGKKVMAIPADTTAFAKAIGFRYGRFIIAQWNTDDDSCWVKTYLNRQRLFYVP